MFICWRIQWAKLWCLWSFLHTLLNHSFSQRAFLRGWALWASRLSCAAGQLGWDQQELSTDLLGSPAHFSGENQCWLPTLLPHPHLLFLRENKASLLICSKRWYINKRTEGVDYRASCLVLVLTIEPRMYDFTSLFASRHPYTAFSHSFKSRA